MMETEYKILSFELTSAFSAWFRGADGNVYQTPVHAIGLASCVGIWRSDETGEVQSQKDLGNFIVGLEFTSDGVEICDEANNFRCLLPVGEKPAW